MSDTPTEPTEPVTDGDASADIEGMGPTEEDLEQEGEDG
jgi:hypothetical protein